MNNTLMTNSDWLTIMEMLRTAGYDKFPEGSYVNYVYDKFKEHVYENELYVEGH
mgnify:CR=1 FL=1